MNLPGVPETLPALVILGAVSVLVGAWAAAWGPPRARWSLADAATGFLLFVGTAGLSGVAFSRILHASWVPTADSVLPGVLGTMHAGVLACVLVGRRAHWAALGLGGARWWCWGAAVAGVPLFLAVSATWSVVASLVGLELEPQQMLLELRAVPVPDRWALVAYGALGAPLVEEWLFRGFLLPPLQRRVGDVAAVVISGVLFGLAHLSDPYAVFPLVVLGMGLGWLRIRSGSIWPGALVHAANNAIALVASLIGATF